MAKEIRSFVASSDVASLIDRGSDVDTQIKNLTYEDKGIKARLNETAGQNIQEGESSIRLKGEKAAAVISAVEKLELKVNTEDFARVREAVDAGLLTGLLDKDQQLVVPPADIERAAEILKSAGINALVAETFQINSEEFKKPSTGGVSSEHDKARKALEACVSKSVSFRVKYEKL